MGAFNDADVSFAQMMIPHHEQALEMAGLADERASNARIVQNQSTEVATLRTLLDRP